MKKALLWAQVPADLPWSIWWPQILKTKKLAQEALVEKFQGSDLHWSRVMDSAKSFSLFSKQKIILIFDADKALRGESDAVDILKALKESPHSVILQSSQIPPKTWEYESWEAEQLKIEEVDDKVAFRWIDFIHQGNLTEALKALEAALSSKKHPLALVQLLSRDFRLGRLIHHALSQRLREDEIIRSLRVNPYAIKKWAQRGSRRKSQWSELFDRLQKADLELKSGFDEAWALRKLTFDMIQITANTDKDRAQSSKRMAPTLPMPLLWPNVPSFA